MQFRVRFPDSIKDPRAIGVFAQGLIMQLAAMNAMVLLEAKRLGRPLPSLYRSGVRWRAEPDIFRGQPFLTADAIVKRGFADCGQLAAWRIAELRVSGIDTQATPGIYWRGKMDGGPPAMYHAWVRRSNSLTLPANREDVSRFLGMPT